MKIRTILWAAIAACVPAAMATPITFTISTTGSGTLGATVFTDATLTFTQISDTGLVSACGTGIVCAPEVTSNTVTISGLGTFTVDDSTQFFNNTGTTTVGFFDAVQSDLLDVSDPAFATYDLQSALGPITDTIVSVPFTSVVTDGGTLAFTGDSENGTFDAVLGTAPEPGSLLLMLAGAIPLGAGLLRRRRR